MLGSIACAPVQFAREFDRKMKSSSYRAGSLGSVLGVRVTVSPLAKLMDCCAPPGVRAENDCDTPLGSVIVKVTGSPELTLATAFTTPICGNGAGCALKPTLRGMEIWKEVFPGGVGL